jgi:hypothetical protein
MSSFVSVVGKNVAFGRSAYQVNDNTPYYASLAVDGLMETFSSTSQAINPWWAVDLGSAMYIRSVKVISMVNGGKQLVS